MKKVIIVTILFALFFNVFSQSNLINLGIVPDENINNNDNIYGNIQDALISTRKFNIIARDKIEGIKNERKFQKMEDFINSSKIKDNAFAGIDYLVFFKSNSDYRKNEHTVQIQIVNINTALILDSKTISINSLSKEIPTWIDKLIPTIYNTLKLEGKYLTLNAGSYNGILVKEIMDIVKVSEYKDDQGNAIIGYEKIGEIEIVDVQSNNISKSKIISGKKNITNIPLDKVKIKKTLINFKEDEVISKNKTINEKNTNNSRDYSNYNNSTISKEPMKKRKYIGLWILVGVIILGLI